MPTWVWVRDTTTGHQYDVDERRLDAMRGRGAESVDGVPVVSGPAARPRPTKYFTGKGGEPATPKARPAAAPADTTTKEQQS